MALIWTITKLDFIEDSSLGTFIEGVDTHGFITAIKFVLRIQDDATNRTVSYEGVETMRTPLSSWPSDALVKNLIRGNVSENRLQAKAVFDLGAAEAQKNLSAKDVWSKFTSNLPIP